MSLSFPVTNIWYVIITIYVNDNTPPPPEQTCSWIKIKLGQISLKLRWRIVCSWKRTWSVSPFFLIRGVCFVSWWRNRWPWSSKRLWFTCLTAWRPLAGGMFSLLYSIWWWVLETSQKQKSLSVLASQQLVSIVWEWRTKCAPQDTTLTHSMSRAISVWSVKT